MADRGRLRQIIKSALHRVQDVVRKPERRSFKERRGHVTHEQRVLIVDLVIGASEDLVFVVLDHRPELRITAGTLRRRQ